MLSFLSNITIAIEKKNAAKRKAKNISFDFSIKLSKKKS